jgi:ribosomal protein L16 Arg81 hydroxylase
MIELDNKWLEWLAENLIRGIDKHQIQAVLLKHGFDNEYLTNEFNRLEHDPVILAARKLFKKTKKLESLLDTRSELFKRSGFADQFGEKLQLTGKEFYKNYFFPNLPVVIRGWMDNWEALRTWSPHNFRERFGDIEIEITMDRDQDSFYEDNCEKLRKNILLKDFVDKIEDSKNTNNYYLVAKNYLLSKPEFKDLKKEFSYPADVLDTTATVDGHVKLWMGPGGTITPLHHDATNILFGQIYGRKHIKLIPYHDIHKLYNNRRCFSEVDLNCPDFERFPLLKNATILNVIVEPGDFIFFPIGWWHWVKALEPSISLSFQNLHHQSPRIVWAHSS